MPASRALPAASRIVLWKSRFSRTSSCTFVVRRELRRSGRNSRAASSQLAPRRFASRPAGRRSPRAAPAARTGPRDRRASCDADGGAAVGRRLDEALGLEHEQRLADRRPADSELPGELFLLQALAGLSRPSRIACRISSVAATLAFRTSPSPLSERIRPRAAKIQYAIRPANASRPGSPDYRWRRGPGSRSHAPSAGARRPTSWSSSASARPPCRSEIERTRPGARGAGPRRGGLRAAVARGRRSRARRAPGPPGGTRRATRTTLVRGCARRGPRTNRP